MTNWVITVAEENFQAEVLDRSQQVPVVVDFWAPWCGPCRSLAPILEKICNEAQGRFVLAKLNTDENPDISRRYEISGIPVVKAFKDGLVVDEFVGALPASQILSFIERIAPDPLLSQLMHLEEKLRQGKILELEKEISQLPQTSNRMYLERIEHLQNWISWWRNCQSSVSDGDWQARLQQHPDDATLLLEYAKQLVFEGRFEEAIPRAFNAALLDNKLLQGEARHTLLKLFELLGSDNENVRDYRAKLTRLLY